MNLCVLSQSPRAASPEGLLGNWDCGHPHNASPTQKHVPLLRRRTEELDKDTIRLVQPGGTNKFIMCCSMKLRGRRVSGDAPCVCVCDISFMPVIFLLCCRGVCVRLMCWVEREDGCTRLIALATVTPENRDLLRTDASSKFLLRRGNLTDETLSLPMGGEGRVLVPSPSSSVLSSGVPTSDL